MLPSVSSISAQSNFAVGAVVNATFGSIIELTFYITALIKGAREKNKCYEEIVKSALTGTLLGCVLLVPVSLAFRGCLVGPASLIALGLALCCFSSPSSTIMFAVSGLWMRNLLLKLALAPSRWRTAILLSLYPSSSPGIWIKLRQGDWSPWSPHPHQPPSMI